MRGDDDRIEQLIAGAVADELTPSEQRELNRLRSRHPWIDDEIADLGAVSERIGDVGAAWIDADVGEDLRRRVLASIPASRRGRRESAVPVRRARRWAWTTPLIAAACLVVGLAVGLGAPVLASIPPSGPPGTLGAVEAVTVADRMPGVDIEADLVAHTWGTEALLDITGLRPGATYEVVFVGADGTEFAAGEMLGSRVPIHCRLNAAVLREDVSRFEIRDADSAVIAAADLPPV